MFSTLTTTEAPLSYLFHKSGGPTGKCLLEVKLGFRRLGVNSGDLILELAVLTTTHTNHHPTPSFPGDNGLES